MTQSIVQKAVREGVNLAENGMGIKAAAAAIVENKAYHGYDDEVRGIVPLLSLNGMREAISFSMQKRGTK